MTTRKQIVAEIRNMLKVYDEQSLLDTITINNNIKRNLKEFGGNLMQESQVTLIIENGKAKLPDNFWSLKAAVKCEQEGYHEVEEEEAQKNVQSVISYMEYTNISDYYNYIQGKPCEEDCDSKYITETLIFETRNGKKPYKFYYNQPKILSLVNHIDTVRCDKNCINVGVKSEYEISIDDNYNYIYTNFNEGFVTIWYKGLPSDKKGDLIIPTTDRDALKNYILYNTVLVCLEMIWMGEDDPNLINKIQYFTQKSRDYYYEAKSESVSKGAVGWATRLINNNRRRTNTYESMFRNL